MDEAVEVIMNFGQYPQPRSYKDKGPAKPKEFDLYDFLEEKGRPEYSDLLEYFILSMNDHGRAGACEDQRRRWGEKIEAMLRAELKDSDIVETLAKQAMEEDMEDQA
jgi:hypothetical protein